MYHYKDKLTNNAQTLRKNMTKEEKRLWYDFLKKLPLSVHRQKTIESYIVDFYMASRGVCLDILKNLGIEEKDVEW